MLSFISRNVNRLSRSNKGLRNVRTATKTEQQVSVKKDPSEKDLLHYRFIYPEFLPDPKIEFRNPIREKLERQDMLNHRIQVDIPEFYVGTIMAVESADKHSPGKLHRFLGICIQRKGCGLRANFTLRNVIDGQGVEIKYDLYDPAIHRIDVIKLEKRLDDEIIYLQDALPEYSTFDPDMVPEILAEGAEVPINPIKVKLKPKPWTQKWEIKNLLGVQDSEFSEKELKRAAAHQKPWEKYDLMKQYMKTIPVEEQQEIFSEMQSKLKTEDHTKKIKRKRVIVKPKKLA